MSWLNGGIANLAEEICESYTPDEKEDFPYIGLEHVEPQSLRLCSIGSSLDVKSQKWRFRRGDILFGTLRPYFRKVIRANCDGVCSTEFSVIRPKMNEDSEFIFYFVSHPEFIEYATTNSKGDRPRTKWELFSKYSASIPPFHIRKRLGSILGNYDDLIANNYRRISLLEESARLLYKEWFVCLRFPGHEHTRIIGGIPEKWEKVTASDVMEILSGGTPKTSGADFWGGEIPFYTPKDAQKACYVLETEKTLTEEGLKNCNSKLYSKNTIFITARGTVGNLNLAQKPMAMNQSCYALKGKPPVSQFFLFCTVQETIDHFKHRAVGAVFDAIIVETFKLIPFVSPVPKLINLFEETAQPIFNQVENLLLQNQRLKQARDLLLPRLMSGEITV